MDTYAPGPDDAVRADIAAAAARIPSKSKGDPSTRFAHLEDLLWPEETVELIVPGRSRGVRGALVATDRRLFFTPDGGSAEHTTDFPYTAVDAIEWHPGMITSAVTIIARGGSTDVNYVDKTLGSAVVAATRTHLASPPADEPDRLTGPTPSGDETVDQLTWLVQMHRTGVLSDAEFAAAKARLLDT